jgi:hypothetical protein
MRKVRESGLAGGSAEPVHGMSGFAPVLGGTGDQVVVELEQVVGRCHQSPLRPPRCFASAHEPVDSSLSLEKARPVEHP